MAEIIQQSNIEQNITMDAQQQENRPQIAVFRFTFSKDFVSMLHNFGKQNCDLDRKSYLQVWNRWIQENQATIEKEHDDLKKKGFQGDLEEKMFKSARYYFRKKTEEAKPVKQRRKYISVDRDILDIIDTHIKNNHQTILSPAKCYNHFIENQLSQIQEEYKRLEEDESLGKEECVQKIKKTYKNRYFQIHNLNTS